MGSPSFSGPCHAFFHCGESSISVGKKQWKNIYLIYVLICLQFAIDGPLSSMIYLLELVILIRFLHAFMQQIAKGLDFLWTNYSLQSINAPLGRLKSKLKQEESKWKHGSYIIVVIGFFRAPASTTYYDIL